MGKVRGPGTSSIGLLGKFDKRIEYINLQWIAEGEVFPFVNSPEHVQ